MKISKVLISLAASLFVSGTAQATDLLYLHWTPNWDAVKYDLALSTAVHGRSMVRHQTVYMSDVLLPEFYVKKIHDWSWQARPLDFDGHPIGPVSPMKPLKGPGKIIPRNAPLPRHDVSHIRGGTLLYPVYSYVGNPGISSYEIEVLSEYPENVNGIAHSMYHIGGGDFQYTDYYDEPPRFGTWYWRVRGKDENGKPIGEWSLPQRRTLSTEGWTIGLFGDSITHGGGRVSYGPNDLAYSYGHYLDFDTINLSNSGDTSETMVERFERDVLPFHLKYLLILGGTNSLRGGTPAEEVIGNLSAIEQKCRNHGIIPILLTLPPINPANIEKTFQEPTEGNWQDAFAKVNAWIRTRPHIDIASAFDESKPMPLDYAVDGLHGDVRAKKLMAAVINAHIGEFVK
jgi:lysophospholipase L1-like esterase